MFVFKGIKNALKKKSNSHKDSVQWQGTFWNDGKKYPFAFENMEISTEGQITGYGTDTKSYYTLTGNVSMEGRVYIMKKREPP